MEKELKNTNVNNRKITPRNNPITYDTVKKRTRRKEPISSRVRNLNGKKG